MTWNLW